MSGALSLRNYSYENPIFLADGGYRRLPTTSSLLSIAFYCSQKLPFLNQELLTKAQDK